MPTTSQQPWLNWKPYNGERMATNQEFVLVRMPKRGPSGFIQGCYLKEGKPFVIGGIFAWDQEVPTHWAEYPNLPEEAT